MGGKPSEQDLETKQPQDAPEPDDLSVERSGRHPEKLSDVPLVFEEQQRRFGGTEAAAQAQLAAEVGDKPLTYEEQRRRFGGAEAAAQAQLAAEGQEEGQEAPSPERGLGRQFGRDPESVAHRQLELWDKNHLEAAVAELRQIKCLDPERWKTADNTERRLALMEAHRVLGRAYNYGPVTLEFKQMDDLGETAPDGSHIWLNEKFLGTDDPAFAQYDHPSWALGTVCHEYRHFQQEENVHALLHGPIRPEVPESVAEHWARELPNYVPGGHLDQESDDLAARICRMLYGQASQYR